MLEQFLDSGGDWVLVEDYETSLPGYGYQHSFDLNVRSDALIVDLTLPTVKPSWELGGEIVQYWEKDGVIHETAYQKIRLREKTIVEISPLAESKILFRPVDWLRGWRLVVSARLVEVSNRDILEQIKTVVIFSEGECSSSNCEEKLTTLLEDISYKVDALEQKLNCICQGKEKEERGWRFKPHERKDNIAFLYYQGFL